jgi:intracellular septation protein A
MLLGLLTVGALWVIGIGQALSTAGNWIVAVGALLVGTAMIVIGLYQTSLMVGAHHWVIEVVHLVLGLMTIGMGHMGAARYRKISAGNS